MTLNFTSDVQAREALFAARSQAEAFVYRNAPARATSALFVHAALVSCICLQRFGVSFGNSIVFLTLPVFGVLLAWLLATGKASVNARSFALYCVTACLFLTSAGVAELFPDARVKSSIASLGAVLVTYSLLTVEPTPSFDTSRTLDIFLVYARVCALLGILQYAAQFAGLRLFSFSMTWPALKPILVEHKYAFYPLLSYGSSVVRSNGFFLLEPSMFSQLLALAVVVDVFVKQRYRFLPLYAFAYLFSFSGTGLVSLVLALALYSLSSPRAMRRGLVLAALAGLVFVLAANFAPEAVAVFSQRAGELERSSSSGYLRYVAQFTSIEPFLREARSLIGYGPGATERSIYWVEGSGNPALKLFIDYGWAGLVAFASFLGWALMRSGHAVVWLLCLVVFQLGGGYLLFSPFIVLAAVVCIWSRSQPDAFAS